MSSYQQVLAGTSTTITHTFENENGPIDVDSGTPTLVVTKPDGTVFTPTPTVQTTWTGPPARATGEYRFVFHAQPDPYKLNYKLTGIIGGESQTLPGTVEWVGEFLFNLSRFRQMRVAGSQPFISASAYPTEDIQETRAELLDEFCQILNFSPVPRYYIETVSATTWGDVVLKALKATKILSVTVNGVTSAASGYYLAPGGSVIPRSNYAAVPWSAAGLGGVTIEYVAGEERMPGRGQAAAMLMAGQALNPAGFSSASSVSLPTGESYSYEPAEMGRWGYERHTGVKELDRWLNRWAAARLGVG